MQLVAAIAGAAILVNTVGYVQGTLQLGKLEYGWVMAAFGLGVTLASIALGTVNPRQKQTILTGLGAALLTLALLPANWVSLGGLLLLWAISYPLAGWMGSHFSTATFLGSSLIGVAV